MSAKQAKLHRQIMANYKELDPIPYTHLQPNPFPQFMPMPEENADDTLKDTIRQYNEDQKVLSFASRIVPKRRLRRMAKTLRIPLALLTLYTFRKPVQAPQGEEATE